MGNIQKLKTQKRTKSKGIVCLDELSNSILLTSNDSTFTVLSFIKFKKDKAQENSEQRTGMEQFK